MAQNDSITPDANYLTRVNIVHPESTHVPPGQLATQGDLKVAASEARGRQHMADHSGLTISGGAIKRGK